MRILDLLHDNLPICSVRTCVSICKFWCMTPPPPPHIRPYHSGVLCLIQLKMESKSSSLIHHSIDIHLVALPQTYTEIYLHLYNVSDLFWPSVEVGFVTRCKISLVSSHISARFTSSIWHSRQEPLLYDPTTVRTLVLKNLYSSRLCLSTLTMKEALAWTK